jgi:ankyrin repeat protein
VEKGCINVL